MEELNDQTNQFIYIFIDQEFQFAFMFWQDFKIVEVKQRGDFPSGVEILFRTFKTRQASPFG